MSSAAWENLHKAMLELAKSSTLKQRLTDAFSRHLQELSATDVPGSLRADFEALCQRMTEVSPMRGETAVAATVRKMSIDEADRCAERIVALLDAVHREEAVDAAETAGRVGNGVGGGPANGRSRAATDPAARIPTLISVNRA